jgi:putative ABC transport system permease protein
VLRRPELALQPDSLQSLMPGQALVTVRPARELFDAKRRAWLVGATMFVAFGVVALLVAAVGLYGVIAYDVGQRVHELGVRVALGAQRADVLALVLGAAARFALMGLALGAAVALAAARWVQPLLFEQSARDPFVFAFVSAVVLMLTLFASSLPALRATRVDPNLVLRSE